MPGRIGDNKPSGEAEIEGEGGINIEGKDDKENEQDQLVCNLCGLGTKTRSKLKVFFSQFLLFFTFK